MIYTPKYKTAIELLEMAGYKPAFRGAGWDKMGREDVSKMAQGLPFKRMHALIRDGGIELHFDKENKETGNHKAYKNNYRVPKEISKFKKLDEI